MNVNDNSNVALALYRDMTGGANGGSWQISLVESTTPATALDDGTWPGEPPDPNQWTSQQVADNCGFSAFSPFSNAGTSIFVRNDAILEADYKQFTIREIAPDPTQYNFESDNQGWVLRSGGMITSVSPSTAHSFYGNSSLSVAFAGPYVRTSQVYVPAPPVPAGKTIQFHIWCPSQNGLTAIAPFVEDGNFAWTDGWQPISAVALNSWATSFSVTVPANAKTPLSRIGIEFTSGSAWTGTCYVDSIGW